MGSGLIGDSQGRFSLDDDAHSQLLDADGFLNVGPRTGAAHSHKRQLILDSLDENAMDGNMGELLGLCSGAFATQKTGSGRPRGLQTTQQGEEEEEELLGLCSGAFPQAPAGGERSDVDKKEEEDEDKGSADNMDELLSLCTGKFSGAGKEVWCYTQILFAQLIVMYINNHKYTFLLCCNVQTRLAQLHQCQTGTAFALLLIYI